MLTNMILPRGQPHRKLLRHCLETVRCSVARPIPSGLRMVLPTLRLVVGPRSDGHGLIADFCLPVPCGVAASWTPGGQPVAFADIRLTSLTLAADIFSSLAVSLTPHPSSRAARISSTRNGAVLGLPNRLPNDRARSSPAITRSRIIARSNSLNTPSTDHSATGFRDHQAQRGRGQENRQQAKDRQGQSLPDAARANRQ